MAKTVRSNLRDGNSVPKSNSAAPALERELYELLFKEAVDGIFVSDGSGRYVDVNERGCKMLGYKRGELLRMNIRDLIPPEDLKTNPIRMEEMLAGKLVVNERRLRCKNGKLLPVEVSGRLLSNGHLLGIVRDISARRTAEEMITTLARFPSENPNPVLRVGFDGKIQYANEASRPLLDEWKTEVGRALPRAWKTRLDACARGGSRLTEDIPCGERVFSVIFAPLPEAGYVNVYGRDVTDRRRAEQALRTSGENYRLLFENQPLPMWVYDLETLAFLEVNEAAVEKYGYTRAEFLGMTLKDICPEADVEKLLAQMEQKRPALQHSGAWWHRLKDGRIIEVEINSHAVEFNGREAALVTAQDVTARKQAEDALRESELKFRQTFDISPVGIVMVGLDKRFIRCNLAFSQSLGYGTEELVGKLIEEVTLPEDKHIGMAELAAIMKGEIAKSQVHKRYLRKDGQVVWGEVTISMIRDSEGRAQYFLAIIQDITERVRAEEAIRRAEKRSSTLIENAPDGIVFVSTDGKFTYASPTTYKLFGYGTDEISQLDPNILTHPDDLPRVLTVLNDVIQNPSLVATIQYRFRHKDGRWLWIESTFSNLIAEPSIQAIVINYRDITEQKRAEKEIIEREAHYRNLFEDSPISLWEEDFSAVKQRLDALRAEGVTDFRAYFASHPQVVRECASLVKVLDVNKATLDLYEASSKEEQLGNLERFFLDETLDNFAEELINMAAGMTEFSWTGVNQTLDGRRIDVNLRWSVAPGYEDSLSRVIISIIDITERMEAELALRASEERYRDLVENISDLICTHDLQGRLISANRAAVELTGYSIDELIGKNLRDFFPSETRHAFDAYLTDIQKNGNASGLMSIRTKSGEGRIWEYHNTLRVEGLPKPIVRGYARDITESRQAEKQIRQLNTELEQRVEERTRELRETQERLIRHEKLAVLGQLAGGVGHELRNPLAVINNAAYYLKLVQPDADVKIKEYLGLIERETRNAEKIISDLLDFARVKSVEREAVSVSELVQRVLARFPAPELVEVTLDIPTGLPQVFADPRQMEQVLGNLVVNACQAMPSGGKLLVLSRVEGSVISDQLSVNREQWILIRVKDTGVGIPPENMNKLFEPLFTTKPKGIGLGLAVSRKLAEANGGRIEVQSEAGVGSTFTVWLPVQVDKQ